MIEEIVREVFQSHAEQWLKKAMEEVVRQGEAKAKELSLLERIIRVEEELKALREIEDARFEAIEKRFEAIEKRFEALQREMNARFEAMEKRFEAIDNRFEALQREMNARFEAMERRFNFMQWFMGIGFSVIVVLMSLINFLK